jgi:hypothetical protein
MRKTILILMLLCAALLPAQTVTVVSSQLADSVGNLASGVLYYQPTDGNGHAIAYRKGGGGATVNASVLAPVGAGVSTISLPDTTLTNPANICFTATLQTRTGAGLGSGYNCLQPHYTATSATDWCQAGVCNLDNYIPNLPALGTVETGPQGPQGIQGLIGPTGPTGIGACPISSMTDGATVLLTGGATGCIGGTLTLVHTTATRALTLSGFTNGQWGIIITMQDATGGAALTGGTGCIWQYRTQAGYVALGANAFPLTSTASGKNIVMWFYDGTYCWANVG